MTSATKVCQNCKAAFTIEPDDFAFYEKIKVPPPTWCPWCRYQRRLVNRNEWNFYRRNCTLCLAGMVSIYNMSYPGPVYCQPCWWGDKWDPFSYGREIDFNRPFFEQFFELRYAVPRVALANHNSVNSEYSNQSENNKNCYMVVATGTSENCMYGNWNQGSKDCVDCWAMEHCEFMYECLNCRKCYRCLFVEDCVDTSFSYFCRDCRGCSNCFGCVGLRNKSYCWFNEQVSKEEYQKRLHSIQWSSAVIEEFKRQFHKLSLQFPVKYYHGTQNMNSTGDYIVSNKNIHSAFNCRSSENLAYGQDAWEARDCMDMTESLDNELDYEMEGAGWGSRCIASAKSWYNHDAFYSELIFNCSNVFGCVSLRKKSYCILNKQYTESQYDAFKEKLTAHMRHTGEWGEFFPVVQSPFSYNDSLAQTYFPLTKEQVQALGWKWYDRNPYEYKVSLHHQDLPETIRETPDAILQETISCSSQDADFDREKYLRCPTAFRIHPQELEFYRRLNIPLPHKCFPCRLQDRLNRRNPRKLWERQCMCAGKASNQQPASGYQNTTTHFHGTSPCPVSFQTSYAPHRPEIVYCEQCYNVEVV